MCPVRSVTYVAGRSCSQRIRGLGAKRRGVRGDLQVDWDLRKGASPSAYEGRCVLFPGSGAAGNKAISSCCWARGHPRDRQLSAWRSQRWIVELDGPLLAGERPGIFVSATGRSRPWPSLPPRNRPFQPGGITSQSPTPDARSSANGPPTTG